MSSGDFVAKRSTQDAGRATREIDRGRHNSRCNFLSFNDKMESRRAAINLDFKSNVGNRNDPFPSAAPLDINGPSR
jgi:hypothetical protein